MGRQRHEGLDRFGDRRRRQRNIFMSPLFAHRDQPAVEQLGKMRALAIEFWCATALVGGAFIFGLAGAIRSLFGG